MILFYSYSENDTRQNILATKLNLTFQWYCEVANALRLENARGGEVKKFTSPTWSLIQYDFDEYRHNQEKMSKFKFAVVFERIY